MKSSGTALVVDDILATRHRLCSLLSEMDGIHAEGCTTDPEEVTQHLQALKPQCVIIDVPAYQASGFGLVRLVREYNPGLMVIVMTNQDTEEFRAVSANLGIEHFLIKSNDFEQASNLVSRACLGRPATTSTKTRVLLLIEDDQDDIALFEELINARHDDDFELIKAGDLKEATEQLRVHSVEVIVLDLRLPGTSGADTVRVVRNAVAATPIVVLTGSDDDALALECIEAGAQDFLTKSELTSRNLKRAIGYSINRERRAQQIDMQRTMSQYRSLSSAQQNTVVTAALAGSGAVAVRSPAVYEHIVSAYQNLLAPLTEILRTQESSRAMKEHIITAIGDASGGPRDLIDIHLEALERTFSAQPEGPQARTLAIEARLLALEMMGFLVDYYRIGLRRHFREDRG